MFITGMVVFALASLAGAVAPSAGFLVVARAIQGVGGAIVSPSTLAVLSRRSGRDRSAIGHRVWGAMTAGGGSAGAILEGILTDELNWRWISSSTSRWGRDRMGGATKPSANPQRVRDVAEPSRRAELRPPRRADRDGRADGGGLRHRVDHDEGWTARR